MNHGMPFQTVIDNFYWFVACPRGGVKQILGKAAEREREYDWLDAADFYKKAMGLVPETDSLNLGQVQERMGYAFHRAAMQTESVDEFRGRMSESVTYFEKAKESYEKLSESGKTPRILRCDASLCLL